MYKCLSIALDSAALRDPYKVLVPCFVMDPATGCKLHLERSWVVPVAGKVQFIFLDYRRYQLYKKLQSRNRISSSPEAWRDSEADVSRTGGEESIQLMAEVEDADVLPFIIYKDVYSVWYESIRKLSA